MDIKNRFGKVIWSGVETTLKAEIEAAVRARASLDGAYLDGASLYGAHLDGASLDGASLDGASLRGAYLRGAYLEGKVIVAQMQVYTGMYAHTCHAVVAYDGVAWVRMGCLWHSVAEWDQIGIRQSNLEEYPDDGSPKCEERVRAFEFTRAAALAMAEEWTAKQTKMTIST